MEFLSKWITTADFAGLDVINIFHKENDGPVRTGEIKNYHTHFRRTISFESTEDVYMDITADDYYKLYINGKFVCQGPAPAYPWRYRFNRVDISSYLKKGKMS